MSDSPPPGLAPDAAVPGGPALTPEAIAAVLEDFRGWLTAAASAPPADEPPAGPGVDLSTLVGQFTALRQEVNLQTRAVRAQQEQNAETLRQLAEAVEAVRETPAAPAWREPAADEGLRPLLKTLVDLYDAAALAGRELQRVQESAAPQPAGEGPKDDARPAWWARWFGARTEEHECKALREWLRAARENAERTRQTLAATAAGFAMTLQRVERAMARHGLEPIPAAGRPFDPELMEVLEVVHDGGRPSGEVVEEVRRGYLWQGRVFRYAQVRVAKNSGQ